MIQKHCFKAALVLLFAMLAFMTAVGLYTTTKAIVAPFDAVSVQELSPATESPEKAPNKPAPAWSLKEPSQGNVAVPSQSPSASPNPAPDGRLSVHKDQRPTEAGYSNGAEAPIGMQCPYVAGPVAASVGELCVFRLNDSKTYADWCIVPEATCYIDSSGSSLAFASNNRATYTILAAIVEDGIPKILTHVCEYGLQPRPDPSPTPNPDPTPKPNPPPNLSLTEWVTQNVPEAGRHQCAALASCYEATADAIENDSILTQAAAFSTIRTASQTKIDIAVWLDFLDLLSGKVNAALDGSTDVKKLGTIFSEIAEGLKLLAISDTESTAEQDVSAPDILPFPTTTCPDSTCKPTVQPLRRAK